MFFLSQQKLMSVMTGSQAGVQTRIAEGGRVFCGWLHSITSRFLRVGTITRRLQFFVQLPILAGRFHRTVT